jgi:hypothetical protein
MTAPTATEIIMTSITPMAIIATGKDNRSKRWGSDGGVASTQPK